MFCNCPNCLTNRVTFQAPTFTQTSFRVPLCDDCRGLIVEMELPTTAMSDPRLAPSHNPNIGQTPAVNHPDGLVTIG